MYRYARDLSKRQRKIQRLVEKLAKMEKEIWDDWFNSDNYVDEIGANAAMPMIPGCRNKGIGSSAGRIRIKEML